MPTKNTNDIKLTPLLKLNKQNIQGRSVSLFAKPNKTQDIIEKFKKEKSKVQKKRGLFSVKNDSVGPHVGKKVIERCKSSNQSRISKKLEERPNIDMTASVILQSYFESVQPEEYNSNTVCNEKQKYTPKTVNSRRPNSLFLVNNSNAAKPQHFDISKNENECTKRKRFSTITKPNNESAFKQQTKRSSLNVGKLGQNPYVFNFHKAKETESVVFSEKEIFTPKIPKQTKGKFALPYSAQKNKNHLNDITQNSNNLKRSQISMAKVNSTSKRISDTQITKFQNTNDKRASIQIPQPKSKTNFTTRIKQLVNKK